MTAFPKMVLGEYDACSFGLFLEKQNGDVEEVGLVTHEYYDSPDKAKEIGRRIVACWNACEWYSTEALEQRVFQNTIDLGMACPVIVKALGMIREAGSST